jgi:hypothetical protein
MRGSSTRQSGWKALALKLNHGRPIAGATVVDDRFHHRREACFQTARPVVWVLSRQQPSCQKGLTGFAVENLVKTALAGQKQAAEPWSTFTKVGVSWSGDVSEANQESLAV